MIEHIKRAMIKKNSDFLCEFLRKEIDKTDLRTDDIYVQASTLTDGEYRPVVYDVKAKFIIDDKKSTLPNCSIFSKQLEKTMKNMTTNTNISFGSTQETHPNLLYRTIGLIFNRESLEKEDFANTLKSTDGINKFDL